MDNELFSFPLTSLPMISPQAQEPPEYSNERTKVQTALSALMTQINQSYVPSVDESVENYEKIQSEWASVKSISDTANKLKETSAGLRKVRPEVQPNDAIRMEREAILKARPSLLMVQVGLVSVVLALLLYVVVPIQYAHYGAFLILATGIAVGIFLSK